MKSANPEHWDYYRRFRRRISKLEHSGNPMRERIREVLLLGPDLLHLSLHLVRDPDVPKKHKVKLGAAIAYFISPVDFLPEIIFGPFGYLDDIAVLAYVLNALLNDVPEHVVDRYWAGDDTVLNVVRGIVLAADRLLGNGLWNRIKRQFGKSDTPGKIPHSGGRT